jgi:hypothetical protein
MAAKVHEIKRTSLLDIPQRLRELANEIESRGDEHRSAVIIISYPDGKVAVRAYGERTSGLETTGWLARAMEMMTSGSGVEDNFTWTPPAA